MKTELKHTPSEFDHLLSLALLQRTEMLNESNTIVMAQHILNSNEISEVSNAGILKKLSGNSVSNKYKLNWILLFLLASGLIATITWNLNRKVDTTATFTVNKTNPTPEPSERMIRTTIAEPEENFNPEEEFVMPVTNDSLIEIIDQPGELVTPALFNYTHPRTYMPEPFYDDEAEIPVLTEAQKEENNKRKLQMLRSVFKKKSYAFTTIPSGPAWRNGERFSVNQFSLQCAEVSNWQYNVFLNDLILQGRNDDYRMAKPVDGNWKAVGIPEFENLYAFTKGYEKFPVLNIPRAGAELYCQWFTDEMGKAIDNKQVKNNDGLRPEFRLPYDLEWLRAARGDHDSTMRFPWGYKVDALQNSKGCYLCNFNYGISKDVLTPIESDGKNCISEKKTSRSVVTTAGRAIDTLVLGPEYCYNPTDFGTYCMLGNAAEMVWTWDVTATLKKGEARAMGGSWYSHADNVCIESKEQFVGVTDGNVNIGFRMVMYY